MSETEKVGSASAEIGKYLDILAKDPNSRVFAPLAEAYRKAGLLDDAIETALEGLKVHPNYLGGRVALGRAYFEKRQYAEAAAEMQKVVKAAPDNLMAHKVLGQIAYGQNDLVAAEKAFKMVLLLDPRDQETQQLIASIAGGAATAPAARPETEPARPAAVPQPAPRTAAAPADETRPAAAAPATEAPPIPGARTSLIPEDLTIEDISLDATPPDIGAFEPFTETAAPAAARPLMLAEDSSELPEIDFSEGELELPTPAGAKAPDPPRELEIGWDLEPPAPPPAAVVPSPAAAAPMELEIFAREPWGQGAPPEPSPPTGPAPDREGAAAPEVSGTPAEGPFEVFGRPKRGGPPQSAKGEREAYAEIELEATAHAPVEAEQAEQTEGGESPFEVFTREPRGGGAAKTAPRGGRTEGATFRELEIETTAYTPDAAGAFSMGEEPALSLEEELPRIDLAREVGLGQFEGPSAPAEEVEPPRVEEIAATPGEDLEALPGGEPMPAEEELLPAPEPEPWAPEGWIPEPALAEPEPLAEMAGEEGEAAGQAVEVSLEDELPHIDLAREVEPEYAAEETPGSAPEPAEDRSSPRGVFDTETLAAIYIDQGFYGRAAEIYERLLGQRPGDPALLQRLEEVRALERMGQGKQAGPAAPVEASAVAPAVATGGADDRVRRLQTLLEAFKGGRPQ